MAEYRADVVTYPSNILVCRDAVISKNDAGNRLWVFHALNSLVKGEKIRFTNANGLDEVVRIESIITGAIVFCAGTDHDLLKYGEA